MGNCDICDWLLEIVNKSEDAVADAETMIEAIDHLRDLHNCKEHAHAEHDGCVECQ